MYVLGCGVATTLVGFPMVTRALGAPACRRPVSAMLNTAVFPCVSFAGAFGCGKSPGVFHDSVVTVLLRVDMVQLFNVHTSAH